MLRPSADLRIAAWKSVGLARAGGTRGVRAALLASGTVDAGGVTLTASRCPPDGAAAGLVFGRSTFRFEARARDPSDCASPLDSCCIQPKRRTRSRVNLQDEVKLNLAESTLQYIDS